MAVTESCQFEERSFGVCVVDVATRRFILGQFRDDSECSTLCCLECLQCFNDLSVSGSLNEANLSVKDSFVEEDPLGLPDIFVQVGECRRVAVAEDLAAAETTSAASHAAATAAASNLQAGGYLEGMDSSMKEQGKQFLRHSPVNGDMYTDISTENAMLQGSQRLSKGVEYLVEASAAEAEAINATLAAAKAWQVNGKLNCQIRTHLILMAHPSIHMRFKLIQQINQSLYGIFLMIPFRIDFFQNLLTSSSNLASISSKLSNTSQRNHFPNQRSGYFLCTRVSSDSVHQLQKQRTQQARAIHSDSDVYFLDDPFGVVDAHAAAFLLYECVMAALAHKIVILVTHQVESL
ncbi:hypothetical protein AAG906_004543 [Vitis piasezkii]